MKKYLNLFTLLVLFSFLSTSCSKEECLDLSESIIGTWESALLGSGNVEFQSDGTLIDEDDLLVGFEINGISYDQKTWVLTENDSKLSVEATDGGSGSFGVDLDVASFDCETLTIQQFGFNIKLSKID